MNWKNLFYAIGLTTGTLFVALGIIKLIWWAIEHNPELCFGSILITGIVILLIITFYDFLNENDDERGETIDN